MTTPRLDLTGKRFGRLVVISYKRESKWLCRCDCGNESLVRSDHLKSAATRSCGCLNVETAIASNLRHGHARGLATQTYRAWMAMRNRCGNPQDPRYGGRGIYVCERWYVYENFLADMGEPPSLGLSIDRINNDGNYEPSNCRWATWSEQMRNRRNSRKLEFRGRTLNLCGWAELLGIQASTLRRRIDVLGWSIERALTTRASRMPAHAGEGWVW